MKKTTRKYIANLLVRELQMPLDENPTDEEINDKLELIESAKDFAMTTRDWSLVSFIYEVVKEIRFNNKMKRGD